MKGFLFIISLLISGVSIATTGGLKSDYSIYIAPSYLLSKFESKRFDFQNRKGQVKKNIAGFHLEFDKVVGKKGKSYGGFVLDFHRGKLNEKNNFNITRIMGSLGKYILFTEDISFIDLGFCAGPLIYRGKPRINEKGKERPNRKFNIFQTKYSITLNSRITDVSRLTIGYGYTHNLIHAIAFKNTTHIAQDFRGHEISVGFRFLL